MRRHSSAAHTIITASALLRLPIAGLPAPRVASRKFLVPLSPPPTAWARGSPSRTRRDVNGPHVARHDTPRERPAHTIASDAAILACATRPVTLIFKPRRADGQAACHEVGFIASYFRLRYAADMMITEREDARPMRGHRHCNRKELTPRCAAFCCQRRIRFSRHNSFISAHFRLRLMTSLLKISAIY